MNDDRWQEEYRRAARILRSRLGNRETCWEVIAAYEELSRLVWHFKSGLLGEAGARAVLKRALQLATGQAPLLQKVRVGEGGFDFGEFREYAATPECDTAEAVAALVQLGTAVFETLAGLAGEALIEPLIERLEEE